MVLPGKLWHSTRFITTLPPQFYPPWIRRAPQHLSPARACISLPRYNRNGCWNSPFRCNTCPLHNEKFNKFIKINGLGVGSGGVVGTGVGDGVGSGVGEGSGVGCSGVDPAGSRRWWGEDVGNGVTDTAGAGVAVNAGMGSPPAALKPWAAASGMRPSWPAGAAMPPGTRNTISITAITATPVPAYRNILRLRGPCGPNAGRFPQMPARRLSPWLQHSFKRKQGRNHKARPIMPFSRQTREQAPPQAKTRINPVSFSNQRGAVWTQPVFGFAGLLRVFQMSFSGSTHRCGCFRLFVTTAGCGVTAELFPLILFFRFFRALMPEFFAIRLSPCPNVHSRHYAHHNVLFSKCQ